VQETPADLEQLDTEALKLVGLTRRAGRAVIGTKAVREAARRGSLSLALVARDAGDNARNRVIPVFDATGTRWLPCGSHETLGRAIGRDRAVVIGIEDARLGQRMRQILERKPALDTAPGGRQER
jgi:ribosomal protein L7Ae-like RNA K-turn-binding protein